MHDLISREGLELDTPKKGDVVTVLIRPPAVRLSPSASFERLGDRAEHENIHHYRVSNIWLVIDSNGSHAAVRPIFTCFGAGGGKPELWAISHHRWFDASGLLKLLNEQEPPALQDETPCIGGQSGP